MFRTAVFAGALLVGPAALMPAPALAAPAAQPPTEARAEVLLGRLVAYSQPHQTTLVRSTEVISAVIVGVDRAIEMYNSGSRDSSWFAAWEQDVLARSAAMRAEIAALPPFPREVAAELMAGSPGAGRRIQGFERVGKEARAAALSNIEFAEQLIPAVRLVAVDRAGDEAMADLASSLSAAARLSIKADMTLLDASIAAGAADHPQTALSLAILGNYRPIDRLLGYQEAVLKGQTPDAKALSAGILGDVADVRREAARSVTFAKKIRGDLASVADVSLRTNLIRAMDTYEQSAAVELKIALGIERLAQAIDGGADPLETMATSLPGLEPLELERAALQTRRLAALAR